MFSSTKHKYILVAGVIAIVGAGGVLTRALLLNGGGAPQSSSDIELQRGLIGWWKLNGNARDSTPYSRNGTITGSPTPVADREGKAGSAYSFSGTGQYISMPNFDGTVMRQGQESAHWTLSIWTTGGSQNGIIFGKTGFNGGILQNGSNYIFSIWSSSSVATTIGYAGNTSRWNLVTAVYDAGSMLFYVNGQLVGSRTGPATMYPYSTTLGIGSGGGSSWLTNATLSDARVYNRALSVEEVTALYTQYDPSLSLDSGENGLIGWWKLDGNTTDSTPFANNATLAGSTVPTLSADREGRANSAYSFDGTATTGGYITASNKSAYTPDVGLARTYSIWMKGGAQPHNGYLFYENGACIGWYLVANTNGSITAEATLGNSGCTSPHYYLATSSGTNYADNKWHLVTGVIDRPNSLISLYVDGALKATGAVDNNTYSGVTSATIRIGTDWNDGNPFAGSLDDARIYNRALSATEAANLYKSYSSQISLYSSASSGGSINLSSGLVGQWDFNGNARDATPYANNGTVSGATLTTDRRGRANSAYQLGDSAAWINVGSPSVLNGANGLSYNIWLMRPGASVYHWPEIMGSSNTHVYYGIRSGNFGDSIYFEYGKSPFDGSVFAGTTGQTLPINTWHMFTITYDGSTLKCYWDGVLKQTVSSVTLDPAYGGMSFSTAANGWNGTIDDARAWSRALNQSEITNLYSLYR